MVAYLVWVYLLPCHCLKSVLWLSVLNACLTGSANVDQSQSMAQARRACGQLFGSRADGLSTACTLAQHSTACHHALTETEAQQFTARPSTACLQLPMARVAAVSMLLHRHGRERRLNATDHRLQPRQHSIAQHSTASAQHNTAQHSV